MFAGGSSHAGLPREPDEGYRSIHFFARVLLCIISQDAKRNFAKSQKQVDNSRKEVYNLRKGQYANCKAIGDECSEEL